MHGQPIELTALAHGEIADVNHFLNLSQTFLIAFAHLVRDKGTEALLFFTEGVAVLTNHLAALWRGPFAPFYESGASCGHDALIVIGVCRAE